MPRINKIVAALSRAGRRRRPLRPAVPGPGAASAAAVAALLLTGCASTAYIDTGNGRKVDSAGATNAVEYRVTTAFKAAPPKCVAILPFEMTEDIQSDSADETFEIASATGGNDGESLSLGRYEPSDIEDFRQQEEHRVAIRTAPNGELDAVQHLSYGERVRRALYAQLAPLSIRDVELSEVELILAELSPRRQGDDRAIGQGDYRAIGQGDYRAIGAALRCDALIVGKVTEYGRQFWGLYSRVLIGAEVRMLRARDGALLWEARHVASSSDGAFPLTPIDLAFGVLRAVAHMRPEELLSVTDDLARRLVKTIPDGPPALSRMARRIDERAAMRYVAANRLNFRAGPGPDYEIQGRLKRDDRVHVVGTLRNGEWLPVRTARGLVGYVSMRHLSAKPTTTMVSDGTY